MYHIRCNNSFGTILTYSEEIIDEADAESGDLLFAIETLLKTYLPKKGEKILYINEYDEPQELCDLIDQEFVSLALYILSKDASDYPKTAELKALGFRELGDHVWLWRNDYYRK